MCKILTQKHMNSGLGKHGSKLTWGRGLKYQGIFSTVVWAVILYLT